MRDLIDQIPVILLAVCAIFFMAGLGYIITNDMAQSREFKLHCIESGMQYISGSCVK
jgi:hypothetical protein